MGKISGLQMKKTDIEEGRIRNPPVGATVLFEGNMQSQGHTITRVELRQYIERTDDRLGDYSLLTALVHTEEGTVELKYDEGFRGNNALNSAATFLQQYVGLASLINRALIELAR
jgi:hypothetical protein